MDEKLKHLIAQASGRIEGINAERDAETGRREEDKMEQDAANFRRYVEAALGQEILEAIGPVTFDKSALRQSMRFKQDSRTFRLQQQTEALVQLQETENQEFSYKILGHQFSLASSDAKDLFLHILGTALKKAR